MQRFFYIMFQVISKFYKVIMQFLFFNIFLIIEFVDVIYPSKNVNKYFAVVKYNTNNIVIIDT